MVNPLLLTKLQSIFEFHWTFHWYIYLTFLLLMFQDKISGSHITFSFHAFLISFNLWQFLAFVLKYLETFDVCCLLIFENVPKIRLFGIFYWFKSDFSFLARILQQGCVFSTSYQELHNINMSSLELIKEYH